MAGSHPQEIDIAFSGNPDLRKRVHAAIDQNPKQSTLFRDISTYILNQTSQPLPEPASKKRKLESNNNTNGNGVANGAAPATDDKAILLDSTTKAWKIYPAVSFSIPQRKKLTLELVSDKGGGVRAIGASGSVEFGVAWKDVDRIFCLPVPEKAKRQHNFIVLPFHADGVNPLPENLQSTPPEPILWTFEEATGKNIIEGEDPGPTPIAEAINECLKAAGVRKRVTFPTPEEFESAIAQSHRKGEKAYHVKAHRGSKEGYLFFTSVGILYGFKKPLLFFDFASITSVSYTNILRNTFNLVIQTPTAQDIEFGMLDQEDYTGINEYVQRHGLQDASMAATRQAKKLNVNPPAENGAGEDDEGELVKAERLLQDEEDEDEEDYEPGSEGESEGSGSDSEDDEDDEDDEDEDEQFDEDVEGEVEGEYDEDEGDEMQGQQRT